MIHCSSRKQLPTVILVHGLRTSSVLWDEQVRALTAAGYPTIAVDLPGHGTRAADRFTMAGALAVLGEAVASCSTPSYVLVGLSLGGYTVLRFAARENTRAADGASSGLVGVVAAACSSDPSTKPVRAYRDAAARVADLGDRLRGWLEGARGLSVEGAQPSGATDRPPRNSGARTPDRFEKLPWAVVTDALTALDSVSSVEDIARIGQPVLLINGRWDHLRLEEHRYLAALPGTELVVIPGAKHDVSLEAPLRFNRALLTFLDPLTTPILAPTEVTN